MTTKIYYWKNIQLLLFFQYNEFERDVVMLPEFFKEHYVMLPYNPNTQDLDKIFAEMNHDKNPMTTTENQKWLKKNGLRHTSMSVGDMVTLDDVWYVCCSVGWKKVQWLSEK